MPKIRKPEDINVGDVFWTSFIDNHGKKIIRHPFIVIQTLEEQVQVLDARSILGAIAVTDIHSKKGKELKKILEESIYSNSMITISDGAKKDSIAQLDTYYLFSKDLLPKDVSKMFSKDKTDEIVQVFIGLMAEKKIFINKSNLKPVIVVSESKISPKERD